MLEHWNIAIEYSRSVGNSE